MFQIQGLVGDGGAKVIQTMIQERKTLRQRAYKTGKKQKAPDLYEQVMAVRDTKLQAEGLVRGDLPQSHFRLSGRDIPKSNGWLPGMDSRHD